MSDAPILFTAFEPSGDALVAAVVAQLRWRDPGRPIYAMAGPRAAEAGAELIETTTEHAVMGAGAATQALAHRRRLKRLARWMAQQPVAAVVPADSPAANWGVCALARQLQRHAPIIHLAAPQLWAWAPWRIRKMRRLSDHVLCLLPFEPDWFASRGMPGTFVGHPVFRSRTDVPQPARSTTDVVRLALLPGSRASELIKNWPTMRGALRQLRREGVQVEARIALRREEDRALLGDVGDAAIMAGRTDEALAWADTVLVVSGTATLQVASHRKPMLVLYNVNRWSWQLAGRWLVRTRTFALPNLIGEHLGLGRVCRELVPHFGDADAVASALRPLLVDAQQRDEQRAMLERVCEPFAGVDFADRCADVLLDRVR